MRAVVITREYVDIGSMRTFVAAPAAGGTYPGVVVREGLSRTTYAWSEYDAEHAFGRDIGHRFDPEATDLAFAETVEFFRRTL
jgi:dienelactone hydrolase